MTRTRILGEDDGKSVAMVARETPTPGNDRTLLQALFGNVGRIGPGAAVPTSPGATGLRHRPLSQGRGGGRD